MLRISGRNIVGPDDQDIIAVFGPSYKQDANVADIIDWLIEDRRMHDFSSSAAFRSYVMNGVTAGIHLQILCTHNRYPGPYTITMSGSRSEDEKRANEKATLRGTPSGYTWHHAEGIARRGSARSSREPPALSASPASCAGSRCTRAHNHSPRARRGRACRGTYCSPRSPGRRVSSPARPASGGSRAARAPSRRSPRDISR